MNFKRIYLLQQSGTMLLILFWYLAMYESTTYLYDAQLGELMNSAQSGNEMRLFPVTMISLWKFTQQRRFVESSSSILLKRLSGRFAPGRQFNILQMNLPKLRQDLRTSSEFKGVYFQSSISSGFYFGAFFCVDSPIIFWTQACLSISPTEILLFSSFYKHLLIKSFNSSLASNCEKSTFPPWIFSLNSFSFLQFQGVVPVNSQQNITPIDQMSLLQV